MEDILGISSEAEGIIGHFIADDAGQAGLAGVAEDANLVSISVLEGEIYVLDTTPIASYGEML